MTDCLSIPFIFDDNSCAKFIALGIPQEDAHSAPNKDIENALSIFAPITNLVK